jgi:hypothetical protein
MKDMMRMIMREKRIGMIWMIMTMMTITKIIMKIITQSKSVVRQVIDLLYKDRTFEQQPLKLEIKLKSTATPDEQLDINQWHQLIHQMNNKKS